MQFAFTEEQEQFRDIVHRFATDRSPVTEVRRLMESDAGFDESVWRQLTGELGLAALHIPEQYGGAGFGPVEIGIVMEEFGRALVCGPYLSSTVLATTLILEAGTEAQKSELLPRLASGETRGAFALVESSGNWDVAAVECRTSQLEDGWTSTAASAS